MSEPMSRERLNAIRERVEAKEWDYLDEAEADRSVLLYEVERLRAIEAGVKALTRVGYDHTPDCDRTRGLGLHGDEPYFHPDCGRCWEDSLHNLLNPTEGDTDAEH